MPKDRIRSIMLDFMHIYSIAQVSRIFGVIACLSVGIVSADENDTYLTLWHRNFDTAPVNEILELALEKTQDLYPAISVKRSSPIEYHQAIASLKNADGKITVLSAASSPENDMQFYAIPFPVLKGLLGKRICLIRKGDQSRFNDIITAYDLRSNGIKICQGRDWPDTQILTRNGLLVTTSPAYQTLFKFLSDGQCDCILRGAQEIVPEYLARKSLFDIETSFLISYSEPGFFYVNKAHEELAARIELGLLRALDDGSYNRLFRQLMGKYIDDLDLKGRKVIRLTNPTPSPINAALEPIDSLWYSP